MQFSGHVRAESCTGLILQTHTHQYPPYLKPHPTRFPTVAQMKLEPTRYKLLPMPIPHPKEN